MTRVSATAVIILTLLLLSVSARIGIAQTTGWLDDDPDAIWSRPPGFYEDDGHWYAILHSRPEVGRVRLMGEFTDEERDAIDLTRTPDGRFWWFVGAGSEFARPPAAGDRYNFLLTGPDGAELRVQDPAARQVENSDLGGRSIVTVSDAYQWRDQAWQRPGWEYYLIYQLHPLRFANGRGRAGDRRL